MGSPIVRRTRKELDAKLAEFAGLLNRPLAGPGSIRFEFSIGGCGGPMHVVQAGAGGDITPPLFGTRLGTANETYERLHVAVQALKLAERCRAEDAAAPKVAPKVKARSAAAGTATCPHCEGLGYEPESPDDRCFTCQGAGVVEL